MKDTVSKRRGYRATHPYAEHYPDPKVSWIWVSVLLLLTVTLVYHVAGERVTGTPVQILLYSHTSHECVIEAYRDGMQVWKCDDGCSYTGRWQPDIERHLDCPYNGWKTND